MTIPEPTPAVIPDGAWRCPACDADRLPDDGFCGRCGAPRPVPAADQDEAAAAEPKRDGFPVARALILNGVLVLAVLAAVVFGGGGGPRAIAFEPAVWRCDTSERAWIASIPASAMDLRIEWRRGGPEGERIAQGSTTRLELEVFATGDGSFRVTATGAEAPECGLEPGTWTMAVRDAANGALLAFGEVELAAPAP